MCKVQRPPARQAAAGFPAACPHLHGTAASRSRSAHMFENDSRVCVCAQEFGVNLQDTEAAGGGSGGVSGTARGSCCRCRRLAARPPRASSALTSTLA